MSKLLSFIATIFSFLLVVYVFNRVNQIENIDKFENYRLYIFSSIGFLILSLISFFIPSKIKINLFLFFNSIFVTFYLIEFFLILNVANNPKPSIFEFFIVNSFGKGLYIITPNF